MPWPMRATDARAPLLAVGVALFAGWQWWGFLGEGLPTFFDAHSHYARAGFAAQAFGAGELPTWNQSWYGGYRLLELYSPGHYWLTGAIGLLVGHRLHRPGDPENPARLERLMKRDALVGLRLSPIYDRDRVWMNDPVSYPLWKKAEQLGAVFNIFLAPHQLPQVGDMARRFPGVKLVIDHFAMIDITRPDREGIDQILALEKFPNVYVRTSLHNPSQQGIPFRDMWPYLRKVYDTFGPRRMIYANFYELLIMKDLVPFFSAEDKRWILGKTARSVYRFGKK